MSGLPDAGAKAELLERRDDALAIRGEDRKRQPHDAVAERRREILGQAEIEQHDFGAGLNQDVAGMRIGVEKAVAQDLVAENLDQLLRDQVLVDPRTLEPVDVGDLDALRAVPS